MSYVVEVINGTEMEMNSVRFLDSWINADKFFPWTFKKSFFVCEFLFFFKVKTDWI